SSRHSYKSRYLDLGITALLELSVVPHKARHPPLSFQSNTAAHPFTALLLLIMRPPTKIFAFVVSLCELSTAYPSLGGDIESLEKRWDGFSNDLSVRIPPYIAPGPDDSRGPCPGLNTLANHGLINRNGKNLNSNDILKAFPRGFGINTNGFFTALHNFEVVCEYVNGVTCGTPENDGTFILTNLTLLGEPHTFEHDHSFSREDYRQKYAHGGITDNIYFNSTIMQKSLNVVNKYKPSNPPKVKRADYQDFNQIRLQRESQQNINDFPGWFQQNIPPTLFETGFIFGATFDRDSKGNMIGDTPSVRLDWWDFWFREESFPTQLGWVPAHTSVFDINFITSVSKAVLAAPITSTPKSLPAGATNSVQDPAGNLPEAGPAVIFPLFGGPPYAAPTKPAAITPAKNKRDAAPQAASTTTSDEVTAASVLSSVASKVSKVPAILASATSIVGSAPPKFNFYEQTLDASSVSAQVAVAQSYESAVIAAITSLAGP
ncbi:hypothetical protein D0862_09111, partial [Hortaea werneckii]